MSPVSTRMPGVQWNPVPGEITGSGIRARTGTGWNVAPDLLLGTLRMPNKLSTILLPILLLTAWPALGAVSEWKSFDEKVDQADAIVLGTLVGSESRLDPDGRWIRTWSTFRVDEVLKGGQGQTVTVVTPGGSVDGIHQESPGAPLFTADEAQILFLRQTAEGIAPLYMEQGVYEVARDSGSRALVRPAASNLILLDQQTGKVLPAEATRTLEQFRAEVRQSLQRREREIARAGTLPESQAFSWTGFLSENALVLVLLSLGLLVALITWIRRQ